MQLVDEPATVRTWLRPVFFVLGVLFMGIGIAGVVLPVVPTTGPLLLAAYFLARSSDRLHHWLVTHPRFGEFIADFQAGRGIPMRGKVTAIVAMVAAFSFSIWVIDPLWLQVGVGAIGIVAIGYVLSLPISDRPAA